PAATTSVPPATHRPSRPPAPATTSHRVVVPPALTVSEAAAGGTVSLVVGQVVHVVLGAADRPGSTYWQFAPPGSGLHLTSTATTPGPRVGACARPGSGCGTVTLTATAASRGQATITASRASCGEALRCSAAQGTFRVT